MVASRKCYMVIDYFNENLGYLYKICVSSKFRIVHESTKLERKIFKKLFDTIIHFLLYYIIDNQHPLLTSISVITALTVPQKTRSTDVTARCTVWEESPQIDRHIHLLYHHSRSCSKDNPISSNRYKMRKMLH